MLGGFLRYTETMKTFWDVLTYVGLVLSLVATICIFVSIMGWVGAIAGLMVWVLVLLFTFVLFMD